MSFGDVAYFGYNHPNNENKNSGTCLIYSLPTKGPCVKIHYTWKMYYITFVKTVPQSLRLELLIPRST